MRFLAALTFLTIIPLPRRWKVSPEEVGQSAAYFPAVGAIIGLILVGLNWLLSLLLPSAVVNVLLIVSLVVISGALHLDGFVDTCDGIASYKSVEERWQVMRDSRVGFPRAEPAATVISPISFNRAVVNRRPDTTSRVDATTVVLRGRIIYNGAVVDSRAALPA